MAEMMVEMLQVQQIMAGPLINKYFLFLPSYNLSFVDI
jgi:hypothetical protein